MTATCRLVEKNASPKLPGDMWYAPERLEGSWAEELSDQYLEDWAGKRPPIIVVLPDKTQFCIDARSTSARAEGNRTGWKVTGDPPNLSCQPSIHVIVGPFLDGHEEDSYHGWLTNGVLEP